MKKLFYGSFFLLLALNNSNKIIAQSANRSLSNLTSPTQVNTDLLPNSTNAYSIGQPSKSWKNIYLKGYIFLDGTKVLNNDGTEKHFYRQRRR